MRCENDIFKRVYTFSRDMVCKLQMSIHWIYEMFPNKKREGLNSISVATYD